MHVEETKVVPTDSELRVFDLNDPDTIELIHHAQESAATDAKLTIRQALKKYKKAVFWAMFLSTSLIMEGYDLVIVSKTPSIYNTGVPGTPKCEQKRDQLAHQLPTQYRSTRSTARANSRTSSATSTLCPSRS